MTRPIGAEQGSGAEQVQQQRVGTQADRRRWDADWIAEQRIATEVIPDATAPRATGTATSTEVATQTAVSRGEARDIDPPVQHAPRTAERETPGTNDRAPDPPCNARLPRALQTSDATLPGAHRQNESARAESPDVTTSTTAPSTRVPTARFAMWRSDDAVRVAMRIGNPARDASGIIAALRAWLRDAGLSLTQVIVNGRSEGSSGGQPGDRAQRDSSSTLNTRI
jgi:hypothetical protein